MFAKFIIAFYWVSIVASSLLGEVKKRQTLANGRQGLNADGPQFTLDGKPITILSGAIHYFRVPRAYWWDRLNSLKSSGLNTVETYVAWNLHEEYPGQFDYSGEKDLIEYVITAQSLGLNVIVRPGPYICAEWEFGGMPAWLLSDASMTVRTTHRGFMEAAERFLNDLLPRLLPYQYSRGGPIIAFQIENEYQSYASDITYMQRMKQIFDRNNLVELLITSDGENLVGRMGSNPLPGVLTTVNFQANPDRALNLLAQFQPGKPLMVTEFWAGWFDHWGDKHHSLGESTFTWIVDGILKRNASINFYMFHGGTNFGFMNGANAYKNEGETYLSFNPTLTSYDYNAPLSEYGEADPKFQAIQRLVQKYYPQNKVFSLQAKDRRPIGTIYPSQFLTLTDVLDHIIAPIGQIGTPVYVEYICILIGGSSCKNPFYGFVAYRHDLSLVGLDTQITLSGVIGDRLQIIVDGNLVNTIYSDHIQQPFTIKVPIKSTSRDLILLVENMGRVNFIHMDEQRKGFNGWAVNDATGAELPGSWAVYDLGLKKDVINSLSSTENSRYWKSINTANNFNQPAFYSAKFSAQEPFTDQFVNFEMWDKGVIFVNAINLGRYWKRGPQKALYLPGPFINQGENQLLMFELHKPVDWRIDLQATPMLG